MKRIITSRSELKTFIVVLVFAMCALSVLYPKITIPAILSIAIILFLYFFNILKKTDLKEKESEVEELLLLTIFFCIYAIYSISFFAGAGAPTILLFFVMLVACLLLLDIFKGLNIFFSSKKEEIYFKVYNPKSENKILFLGDSIMTNQGVRNPEKSMAALFLKDFPDLGITTIAKNGLTTRGLLKMIEEEKDSHYKVAIISTGGNDIAVFRSLKKIKAELAEMFDEVGKITDNIVLIFSYDIGRAPIFSKTILTSALSKFFTVKSERLIEILLELKRTKNFLLWNLNDPSLGEESLKHLYDIDSIHPNEEGYYKLYEEIVALLQKKNIKL